MPLVAMLRGITPREAVPVADILMDAGFYFLAVTINSPAWESSLGKIKARHSAAVLLGAGTVLSANEVTRVQAAGGQAVISPNTQAAVMERNKNMG